MTPSERYWQIVRRSGFHGTDPLTSRIIHAIANGRELPDEFTILDTYYDIGAPEVEHRCERIRSEVRRITAAAGIPMRQTFTMLDQTTSDQETTHANP